MNSLELLKEYLKKYPYNIYIEDGLTKGKFRLLFGEHNQLHYNYNTITNMDNFIFVTSFGLEDFHNSKPFVGTTKLDCTLKTKEIVLDHTLTIAYRGIEVIDYGAHFMGYCICKMFEKLECVHG